MAGFFKKLFNRITGKKEEAAPQVEEQAALPAPEPELETAPEEIIEERAPHIQNLSLSPKSLHLSRSLLFP